MVISIQLAEISITYEILTTLVMENVVGVADIYEYDLNSVFVSNYFGDFFCFLI